MRWLSSMLLPANAGDVTSMVKCPPPPFTSARESGNLPLDGFAQRVDDGTLEIGRMRRHVSSSFQYRGTEGSTIWDHASMPPFRL